MTDPGDGDSSRSLLRRAKAACSDALDVFFPPSCESCHGIVETSAEGFRYLCDRCVRKIVLVGSPHCPTCGHPFFGALEADTGCSHCENLRPVFREGRTLGLLRGPLRRLVHAFKYERALHVLDDVAILLKMNEHFRGFLDGAVLVPVPLHPRKEREREFNQARLLAECFAAHSHESRVKLLISRVMDTKSQTRLDRIERSENLKNAFAMDEKVKVEPALRYVLVDDVFTTGATLNACAAVLRAKGVTKIDVATLGHG